MNPDERTLLLISGAALVAVIVWKMSAPMRGGSMLTVVTGGDPIPAAGYSQSTSPENLSVGPDYLVYNSPYAYNPALGNVMPSTTVGQIGQVSENPSNFDSDCGCYK